MKRVVTFLLLLSLFLGCYSVGIMGRAAALSDAGQSEMNNILKNITGATEFTVNQPVDNGIVVDMKDYGLSESNTPAANETAFANAIAKVKSSKAWKLNIPKGTYHVALTGKEAISLSNLNNFLLEGNGSKLIFSVGTTLNNTPAYITMNNSNTIAIRNLTLDWDRSVYPIYGIGKITAVNKTNGTVDFQFSDITVPDDAIFGGGRSWDPATDNRSETVGFQFPGGSSGISSMTKLASNKVRLTYKNANHVSSAVVGQYGQFWFRPKELVNGFRMQTNTHISFDNLHMYTVPYQAIFSNDTECFEIINSSVEPPPNTKERFSSYGGIEVHSVDGHFRMENCKLKGINDDNIHLSNHFFGGGVSGNPKIDNYTVALDHLTHWMHYTEVYVGATFGMRDKNFKDLGWKSKVVSFTWENYFTDDGNAPWRCTVKFADPLPSNYASTNQFWNMDKNTGNYIIRNNTFEGGLAHAMYLGLSNGTVENNSVSNFAYPGLILNCLIRWDRWAIGTPINNVIICNNTLKECNKALRDPAAMFVGGGIDEQPSDYNPVSGRITTNVLVEGNTVETTPWAAFGTFSSQNIVIRNNSFVNASTTAKKSGKPGGNIFITNADHVVCTGNTIYHGGVSYETGINVDKNTTTNIYSESNSVQKYVKANGLYGDIIVDTNTYGFKTTVGTWSNSSYTGYSGTVKGSSSTGAQVRWTPLLRRGHYQVYIYKMVVGSGEAADEATKIEVKHKNGTYTTTMNCHSGTKGFVSLGTFEFDEGAVGYVQATRSSSTLRVSAVKFVRMDECAHGAKSSTVKPTCTEKGYVKRTCSTCGYTYKQDYTAALGHSYVYTNAGIKHNITCSRCDYSSTANHSYTNGNCLCGVKDSSHNLYFDFKNSNTDKARYTLSVYGGYNFDQSSSPYWATGANGGATNVTVNNTDGTMTVKVIADPDSAGNYGPYIETTNTYGKYPWSGESYRVYYPLNYSPVNAEYLQIRFKLTGCTSAGTSPKVIVCFDTLTGSTYKAYENLNAPIDGKSTAYQLITIPLNNDFKSAGSIQSLGLRFRDVKATSSNGGSVVIDYIFVGKRTEMPNPLYTVTFKDPTGNVLATTTVSKGATATYSGATPTKAVDATYHYSFKGWDKALTNITADTTVTAQFTPTAHSYTYTKVDNNSHKGTCSCNYSVTASHAWNTGTLSTQPTCTAQGVRTYTCSTCKGTKTEAVAALGHSYTNYKATKNPTTSATGTLTGTCSKCSGTTTVSLPKLNTTDYTKTVTKAATCTATGTDSYKWKTTTYGSFTFTATTAALGHSYTTKVTAPTCTAQGYTTHTCSRCSDSYKDTYTNATGHSYTSKVTTSATCTKEGVKTFTCSKCSHSYTEAIAATGHTPVTDKAVAATCTTAGKTEGSHCSVCNAVIKAQETVPATGHSYTSKVTTAATCTKAGVKTYTCSKCSHSYTEAIAATGHTPVTDKAVAATCTTAGKTEGSHCSVCNAVIKEQTTIPATGHSYTAKVTTAATCTKAGVKTFTCSKCNHSYTEAIAATGHTSVTDKAVAATCTTAGKTEGSHCSVCNAVIKAQTTVPATGHSYTSKVTTAATCTKAGVKTFTCSKCNHSYTEAIAATGHTPVTDKAVAATCTTDGKTEGSHCSVCNAVIKAQTTIPATGHSYTSKVTTAATCTKAGVKTFTCSKCSHSYTEAIAATGHTPVTDKAVAATCTTAGKTEGSHCSVCNAVIKAQTTVPATGHSYTSKVTTAATCTKAGVNTYTCSKCNHSYTEAIAATGHTPVTDKAVVATCTTAGKTEGSHCSVCNAVIKAQETVPALGHDYTGVITDPTCTEQGYTTHTCFRCSDSYKDSYTDATGHSYRYTDKGEAHEAVCGKCSHSFTEAHSYTDHTCVCGAVEVLAPITDSSIVINHSLNLASDISINYAVKASLLSGYDSFRMEVQVPIYNGNALTGFKTVTIEPVLNGSYYYFTMTELTAIHMNDILVATLHMNKGKQEYVSKPDSYSVATYALGLLNQAGMAQELKVLCADLLRYGAAAQTYKNYRTDALATASMTEAHKAYWSDLGAVTFGNTNTVYNDISNPMITWAGKTLNLGSKVVVKFVFNAGAFTGDISKLTLRMIYQGSSGAYRTVTLSNPTVYNEAMRMYAFEFDGLMAAELRTALSVAVYNGDTQLSQTMQYSADTYGNSASGTLLELCKALFAYSDSAKVYFTK